MVRNQESPESDLTLVDKCIAPQGVDLIGAYGDTSFQYNRQFEDGLSEFTIKLFSQGMLHLYGFNRPEAERNFQAAVNSDSSCISCYLGLAMANGPNINNGVDEDNIMKGKAALQNALKRVRSIQAASSKDSYHLLVALIEAQISRFANSTDIWNTKGQEYFDQKYAEKMKSVFEAYPYDDDVASLYAESLVLLSPWFYFQLSSRKYSSGISFDPQYNMKMVGVIQPAFDILKSVLDRNIKHPLALHMYIHITEQGLSPQLGERGADALFALMQSHGAGHLVHMPAHTYLRVGRFADAIEASLRAVALDNMYTEKCFEPYASGHNIALLVMAAIYSGREAIAVEYAAKSAMAMPAEASQYLSALFPTPLDLVLAHFGRWDSILKLYSTETMPTSPVVSDKEAASTTAYAMTIKLYAQTLALVGSKRFDEASESLAALGRTALSIPPQDLAVDHIFYPYHAELAQLMNATANAAYLLSKRNYDVALRALEEAVLLQDTFSYMEPENFYFPLRQCVGAARLYAALDGASTAEASPAEKKGGEERQRNLIVGAVDAYVDDLKEHPRNGWSLKGLLLALQHLGSLGLLPQLQRTKLQMLFPECACPPSALLGLWKSSSASQRESCRDDSAHCLERVQRDFTAAWRLADRGTAGSCCEFGMC